MQAEMFPQGMSELVPWAAKMAPSSMLTKVLNLLLSAVKHQNTATLAVWRSGWTLESVSSSAGTP